MIARLAVATWLAAALGACTLGDLTTAQNTETEVAKQKTEVEKQMIVEPVKNPLYDAGKIRFTAISNGCTAAADFQVEHAVNGNICELTLVRSKPDYCRKASAPVDLELEWLLPVGCAGLQIVFQNPELDDAKLSPGRPLSDARVDDN